jgi:hypothetical protein
MIEQLLVPLPELVKDMDRPLCPIILGTYLAAKSRESLVRQSVKQETLRTGRRNFEVRFAESDTYRSQPRSLNLESWLPYTLEDDGPLVSVALLGPAQLDLQRRETPTADVLQLYAPLRCFQIPSSALRSAA